MQNLELRRGVNEFVLYAFLYFDISFLGGYVDGMLLSRDNLMKYSKLPDLDTCWSETAGILSLIAGGKTSSLIYSHAQTLGANLKQYEKQIKEESD